MARIAPYSHLAHQPQDSFRDASILSPLTTNEPLFSGPVHTLLNLRFIVCLFPSYFPEAHHVTTVCLTRYRIPRLHRVNTAQPRHCFPWVLSGTHRHPQIFIHIVFAPRSQIADTPIYISSGISIPAGYLSASNVHCVNRTSPVSIPH
ncbi:UNVERIFIED_CONTAM: hypothetical protein Sangu_2107300 [Sesamum angustifolium]|uniref:Uncharacterized protein n=1 Tax=Sesamum angustifolium TaxID=2727405 RepID=A0AAW2LP66_9LAMI